MRIESGTPHPTSLQALPERRDSRAFACRLLPEAPSRDAAGARVDPRSGGSPHAPAGAACARPNGATPRASGPHRGLAHGRNEPPRARARGATGAHDSDRAAPAHGTDGSEREACPAFAPPAGRGDDSGAQSGNPDRRSGDTVPLAAPSQGATIASGGAGRAPEAGLPGLLSPASAGRELRGGPASRAELIIPGLLRAEVALGDADRFVGVEAAVATLALERLVGDLRASGWRAKARSIESSQELPGDASTDESGEPSGGRGTPLGRPHR